MSKRPSIPLTDQEQKYIVDNCLTKTDAELSRELNRDVRTIRAFRKKSGVEKRQDGKISYIGRADKPTAVPSKYEEASKFFQEQFKNTLYYKALKDQFTEEEIDYYLEEWGSLCVQFEDIVATEKRQIDELIKAEIIGLRIMRNVKLAETVIEELQNQINVLRSKKDVVTDEDARIVDEQLSWYIGRLVGQSNAMTSDYRDNVDLRNKILTELNARRRDRIDQLRKTGTTFAGLVQAFRDNAIREAQGKQLELVRIAKNKKLNDWRKITKFPDGTKDAVVFDENSEVVPGLKEYLENPINNIVEKYKRTSGKNILIVEDDHARKQFFQDLFAGHNIEFSSNFHTASEKLKTIVFDLICFDYDIGLDLKGDIVAGFMIENKLCLNADVLIHSMNDEGADKIFEILHEKVNVEKYNFETMLQAYGRKNAENS